MKKIAVFDIETDPFEYGSIPQPFVCEYFDGVKSIVFWGRDCISQMVRAWENETPAVIYAHNGGKFDYLYLLEYMHADMKIVNGRIIQAYVGAHELRDSFAILPFPLRDFDKDEIDYEKMRKDVRHRHREEILKYLHKDCTSLYELVTAFFAEFGDGLTVGGTALRELKKFHSFTSGGKEFDAKFRKDFYFGGRNQAFQGGLIRGPVKIYDINSSYPYSMKSFLHPVNTGIRVSKYIEKDTCFVVAEGFNDGAFPIRNEKTGGLDFTKPGGRFCTTIHEWEAALQTGCFRPTRIVKTYGFAVRQTFTEFVDHFYGARLHAKAIGDKIHALFYKYITNSSYGKFAQNPENYSEWQITKIGKESHLPPPWEPAFIHQGKYIIWEKPLEKQHFYNICTGSSITGASRALLLRGLRNSINPLYCDTDSIICRSLRNVNLSESELGGWKAEGSGTCTAIAGKKMYAVFQAGMPPEPGKGEKPKETLSVDGVPHWVVKKAHKGARLSGEEILRVARGEVITYLNPVPAWKLDGNHKFTKRKIRRTV
jgi:hypothetical protein